MSSQKPDEAVRLAWRSRLSQFQFWSSSQIVNVARRPTDIFILIGTLVGFVVVTFLLPDDFLAGLQLDPGLTNIADPALLLSSIGLMVWGLFVFGMSVFSQSHRRILMQYLVAIAISVGASMIAVSRKDGGEFFQIGTIGIWEPHWSFSTVLPLGVALVSTASPFLSRRARIPWEGLDYRCLFWCHLVGRVSAYQSERLSVNCTRCCSHYTHHLWNTVGWAFAQASEGLS